MMTPKVREFPTPVRQTVEKHRCARETLEPRFTGVGCRGTLKSCSRSCFTSCGSKYWGAIFQFALVKPVRFQALALTVVRYGLFSRLLETVAYTDKRELKYIDCSQVRLH